MQKLWRRNDGVVWDQFNQPSREEMTVSYLVDTVMKTLSSERPYPQVQESELQRNGRGPKNMFATKSPDRTAGPVE